MADDGRAALRPVAAGGALVAHRKGSTVRLRAGEDVVHVGRITAAIDGLALLVERRLLGQVVLGPVQVVHALGDDGTLGVAPRPRADAIAGVDDRCVTHGADAQVGAPGAAAGTGRLRQLLAMLVGAGEPAELATLARTGAGDEKGHGALLRLGVACPAKAQQHRQRAERKAQGVCHRGLPVGRIL